MQVASFLHTKGNILAAKENDDPDPSSVQLVLGFGARHHLSTGRLYQQLRSQYPNAGIILSSTAGEIFDAGVSDDSVTITAIHFRDTLVRTAMVNILDYEGDSHQAGIALVKQLIDTPDICHLLVFSDGSLVNGSHLVKGLNQAIGARVPITGGLAGDGTDFTTTLVGLNAEPRAGVIAAVALYGNSLLVSCSSMGGWEMFGPEMTITSSTANRLFTIDGNNALELYKKYLGPYAAGLPGAAMFFPLSVWLPGDEKPVVRSILSIDSTNQSMTFAGNVPQGSRVRLMKGHLDKVIEAAGEAAGCTYNDPRLPPPRWALLISCVGRKIALDSRIEEEIEAVRDIFPPQTITTGFYSYGELSPHQPGDRCELHNQSMTITTFVEV